MTTAKRVDRKSPSGEQMKAFEERMKKREDKQRPEEAQFPYTDRMKKALEREIPLNQRCPNCKHMNKHRDHHLAVPFRFNIFTEAVPLMVWICNQCGMLFAPKWGRTIIKEGVREQIKQHERIEVDG